MTISERPTISVCMATYNGALFLQEQVDSILAQLGPDDELITLDDASTDDTVALLRSYNDPRVRVEVNGQNLGHVQTFAKVMGMATKEIIILSDQDDIWLPGRLDLMVAALVTPGVALVSTNMGFMDMAGKPTEFAFDGLQANASRAHLRNILDIFKGRTNYYGCAMACQRRLLDLVLPIPSHVESHDLWIALAANFTRQNLHLEARTLIRRIHGNNASVVLRPLHKKLWSRIVFMQSLAVIAWRSVRR